MPSGPSRRSFVAGAATAWVAGAGCADDPSRAGAAPLTIWSRSDQAAFMQDVVDGFNRDHDDVRVDLTVIPNENFVQKLGIAAAGGSGPDLASIDLVYVPFFAHSGVLADITDKVAQLEYLDQMSEAHLQNSRYEGRMYALPFTGDASMLFYNTDLFRQAGLDPDEPPRTWAEMLEAARGIDALGEGYYGYSFSGACGGCNVFTFLPLIWASGGDILAGTGEDERPILESEPAVAEALEFYRTMWTEGLVPEQIKADSGELAQVPFRTGQVGMFSTGSFTVGILDEDYPELDYRVTPIPGREGGSASFAGGDNIAITATSQRPDEAWRFLEWSSRADVQDEFFGQVGVTPVRADVASESYSERGEAYAAFARSLFNGQTVYSVQENALINGNTSPWAKIISRAVFDGEVDAAIAEAQDSMANILARG